MPLGKYGMADRYKGRCDGILHGREIRLNSENSMGKQKWKSIAKGQSGVNEWKIAKRKHQE